MKTEKGMVGLAAASALTMIVAAGCDPDDFGFPPGGGGSDGDIGPDCVSSFDGSGELSALDDEFDNPQTLACWLRNHEVEGTPAQYTSVDIGASTPGALTLLPTASGWYQDVDGPFFFKYVSGDFVLEVQLEASSLADPDLPPSLPFSSAGVLARDPASTSPGGENWVMYDVGQQLSYTGTEGKTTVDSASTLFLEPAPHRGRIRVCRVGSTMILARRLEGEATFTERHVFERSDFPETLQVGLCATAFNGSASVPNPNIDSDLRAVWDYARFSPIDGLEDCLAE